MDNRLMINQPVQPLDRTGQTRKQDSLRKSGEKADFKELLQKQINQNDKLQFSKHAKERIASRRINVSNAQMDKLTSGLEKAADKGSKDSLIMVDGVAYVVSVENNTVITAIDNDNIKENVFTNIDSAVFM
ncbi:flagellar protein [Halanaerobiaceae bacterium Z-7014]|uniref:Flagellar protein n=1 Tax=Halonatronomonas betaini TaxID=2778430 RepID=A0A931F8T2_9FIRM|nr:TIGR02530 family flagellar biosynthesis protein [Halonatronomonas betaini]MBF8435689.1 flagellar protein [Halonatronomonas betaini]